MDLEQARLMLEQIKANPQAVNDRDVESAIDGVIDALPFSEVQWLLAELGRGHANTEAAARRELFDAVRPNADESNDIELDSPLSPPKQAEAEDDGFELEGVDDELLKRAAIGKGNAAPVGGYESGLQKMLDRKRSSEKISDFAPRFAKLKTVMQPGALQAASASGQAPIQKKAKEEEETAAEAAEPSPPQKIIPAAPSPPAERTNTRRYTGAIFSPIGRRSESASSTAFVPHVDAETTELAEPHSPAPIRDLAADLSSPLSGDIAEPSAPGLDRAGTAFAEPSAPAPPSPRVGVESPDSADPHSPAVLAEPSAPSATQTEKAAPGPNSAAAPSKSSPVRPPLPMEDRESPRPSDPASPKRAKKAPPAEASAPGPDRAGAVPAEPSAPAPYKDPLEALKEEMAAKFKGLDAGIDAVKDKRATPPEEGGESAAPDAPAEASAVPARPGFRATFSQAWSDLKKRWKGDEVPSSFGWRPRDWHKKVEPTPAISPEVEDLRERAANLSPEEKAAGREDGGGREGPSGGGSSGGNAGGLTPQMPGFADALFGRSRLNWQSGEFEWKGGSHHGGHIPRAKRIDGQSAGETGPNLQGGGTGGQNAPWSEMVSLLKEIRDALKSTQPKQSQPTASGGPAATWGPTAVLGPIPKATPRSVPGAKG
jgi:hypothetical protein